MTEHAHTLTHTHTHSLTHTHTHSHTPGKLGMGKLGKRGFLSYREVNRLERTLSGEMG